MPPANSPLETPNQAANAPSPYLEQFAELASPVPDFAATLTTQAEQDAHDDNVSFLRTPLGSNEDLSAIHRERPRQPFLTTEEFEQIDTESQRRMHRAVARQRRYTPFQLQQLAEHQESTRVTRTAPQQPGYNGWAPGSLYDEEAEPHHGLPSISQLSAEFAGVDHDRYLRGSRHMSNVLEHASDLMSQSTAVPPAGVGQISTSDALAGLTAHQISESSLRTTALLQSVRRHARLSTRSRSQWISDRERIGQENEDRERQSSARLYRPPNVIPFNSQHQQQVQQRELRNRVDGYRQCYLENPSGTPHGASRWLEEAIKYLERLRFCTSYQESLSSAAAGGFLPDEFFSHNQEDFILDTTTIDPPPESSWLKVGGVFSGSQHAAGGPTKPLVHVYGHPPPSRAQSSNRESTQTSRGTWITNAASRTSEGDERWPVKVTIHSIDYSSMTLSGTMEAFNVPDKSSPSNESSITTFLEGEIVDFNTHTLETKSFKADARVDGTYWRKLEPFKRLTDDEIARNIVSREWLNEELAKSWILMRWKEKCFVTPSDAQSGLTISGFYYVCLRREDGYVEGLYYDPHSTPFQHLSLTPEKRMFPAYSFQ
ncbi:MAG: hypothetical protein FRX48_08197 [Lasallia pustulata]|uniref:Vacuolar import/degradation protein Vid24 n=1 Tax=Lasallia pustulata TaxID=136370 RepID=A0A5M8PG00_9LECA|nr:MAG: hypothetical protein FRX48_08197 [Lasallia pustulata]